MLQDINTVFTRMDDELCSINCPCDQTYKDNFAEREGETWTWSPNGAVNVEQCPGFDQAFGDDQKLVEQVRPFV